MQDCSNTTMIFQQLSKLLSIVLDLFPVLSMPNLIVAILDEV